MAGESQHRTLGERRPATPEMVALFPYAPALSHDSPRYVGNRHGVNIDVFVTRYARGYEVEYDNEAGDTITEQFPTWEAVVAFYVTLRLEYGNRV